MASSSTSSKTSKHENARFAPFIPALELTPNDTESLAHEAHRLVSLAVDEYQYYRTGAADWTKWKEVRRVDTLRVFRERQSITKNDIDSTGAPLLPEVLAIGNVSGTVDDMLYGAMASTATAMLANARAMDESLCEARVMASLVAPTVDEPFRSLTAKWFSFSLGSGMCSLRDCSILESTGMVTLENGEKLGYVLRHSVSFRGVPDLQPFGVLRAQIASWAIYRESGPGMVQCFVKSFHDLGAGTWKAMGLKSVCDRALALCKFRASAETKRLARLLRVDAWDVLSGHHTIPTHRRGHGRRSSDDSECAVCLVPFASSILGSSARQCKICRFAVCARCLEKKTVHSVDDDAQRVTTQQLRVCVTCVSDAQHATSVHLQVEEILAQAEHTTVPMKLPHLFKASLTDSEDSSDGHL